MITFTQWAKNENKDLSMQTIDEKQIRTVSAFPGGENYPPQTGAPNGDDSIYPRQYTAAEGGGTGVLSVELADKKKKKRK